jgi:UDP-N-acetylmuramyl pentapeptide phosphotransferase/UDP-N-acetylglucosamine-1-phosphate transferase
MLGAVLGYVGILSLREVFCAILGCPMYRYTPIILTCASMWDINDCFPKKHRSHDTIEKYKARLVAMFLSMCQSIKHFIRTSLSASTVCGDGT